LIRVIVAGAGISFSRWCGRRPARWRPERVRTRPSGTGCAGRPDTLAWLGFPVRGALGVRPAASMDTLRRIIELLHPDGLAALLRPAGTERARPTRLAADGKSARGSRTRMRTVAHLLAVVDQDDQVIAQLRIPDKTNEIPCLRELLAGIDIEGAWVSADALHTQAETARFLVEDKKAHYLLTVKLNQPTLYDRCRRLPWKKATAKYYDRAEGHGRKETRVVQVLTVTRSQSSRGWREWCRARRGSSCSAGM
jgi:predicted transposase YbfD/YdcC